MSTRHDRHRQGHNLTKLSQSKQITASPDTSATYQEVNTRVKGQGSLTFSFCALSSFSEIFQGCVSSVSPASVSNIQLPRRLRNSVYLGTRKLMMSQRGRMGIYWGHRKNIMLRSHIMRSCHTEVMWRMSHWGHVAYKRYYTEVTTDISKISYWCHAKYGWTQTKPPTTMLITSTRIQQITSHLVHIKFSLCTKFPVCRSNGPTFMLWFNMVIWPQWTCFTIKQLWHECAPWWEGGHLHGGVGSLADVLYDCHGWVFYTEFAQ